MQKLILLFSMAGFALMNAQQISDYQYVYVPKKFTEFNENQYKLNDLLASKLQAKKYVVLKEEPGNWPLELQQNPCKVLRADAENTSSMLRNKITVNFKDCNGKTVATFEGKSAEKDYEPGYREALTLAAQSVGASQPKEMTMISQQTPVRTVEEVKQSVQVETKTVETRSTTVQNTSSVGNKAEIFSNGGVNFNKINLGNGQFILNNPKSSIPFATFSESTKTGVYRVKLEDGTQTIGYDENGNVIIEIPQNGSYRKAEFKRN